MAKEVMRKNKMPARADWQEFGNALHEGEDKNVVKKHVIKNPDA
jgi:hypothetical protein